MNDDDWLYGLAVLLATVIACAGFWVCVGLMVWKASR